MHDNCTRSNLAGSQYDASARDRLRRDATNVQFLTTLRYRIASHRDVSFSVASTRRDEIEKKSYSCDKPHPLTQTIKAVRNFPCSWDRGMSRSVLKTEQVKRILRTTSMSHHGNRWKVEGYARGYLPPLLFNLH